ncbi:MAG: sodium:solute symporter family protein [Rhodospirillaceae bacterium]|nr:sodium:solute symporter family protein [Rhodospirillaceae bacterium]
MNIIDYSTVIVYLIFVVCIGLVYGARGSAQSFWVNDRKTSWILLGVSLIATQLGAGAIVGIATGTYSGGIGLGVVTMVSSTVGFLALSRLAPYIQRFGVIYDAISLPEFLKVRYGRSCQLAAAIVVLFTYFSLLAAQFLAIGAIVHTWTEISFGLAVLIAAVGVVVYISIAGIRGDMVTDVVHFIAMLLVFGVFLIFLMSGDNSLLTLPDRLPSGFLDPVNFGGWSFLIGGVLFGGVVPLVAVEIWQRAYAACNPETARRVFAGSLLIIIPAYVGAMIIGLYSVLLVPADTTEDASMFVLMAEIFPPGLYGFAVVAVFATILSTANSMILVVSASVYRDIFGASFGEGKLLASRGITFGVGFAGLVFAFLVPSIVQSILNAIYVLGVIALPIVVGLFWRRATNIAATLCIVSGALVTAGFIPIAPKQAFLPGAAVAIVVFFVVTFLTKHGPSENPDLLDELRS